MTQIIEADLGALQTLITTSANIDTDIDNLQNSLLNAFNAFDATFIAPQKGQLESDIQQVWNYLQQADILNDNIRGQLQTLLNDLIAIQNLHL